MKVSDVMSKQVERISPLERVEKAALLIFGRNINGVPVCVGRKIVGFVTEKDILAKFLPTFQDYVEDTVHSSNFEKMEEQTQAILSLPVDKIMSKHPVTVRPETPLLKAHTLMTTHEVGRLPVVDEDGNLVGIVAKGDVFRSLIGDKLLFTENEDYNDFLSKTYYSTVDTEDRLNHEIPDLIKLFQRNNVRTVLDVGCGTGDHAIELAKRGYTVVGTDRSREMVLEANRRKLMLGKEVAKNVNFINSDTEDVLFDMNTSFDAILVMGNTLSHNPHSYKQLLRTLTHYLSDNGVMVFQVTNFEKVLKAQNRLLNFNFVKPVDTTKNEYAFLEYYDNPIESSKTILKTFAILSSDKKRWKWEGIRNSLMAHITSERIKEVLEKQGIKKISLYGGAFDGKHWDYLFRKSFKPLESDWLNIVATRK
jgi:CBS domain-containing protein/ubiquinone/menaquinone biosynthesis C-methylase UbiE